MKLVTAITLGLFCLVSSSSAGSLPNPQSLKKIDNTNYIIGDKSKAIETFILKATKNGQLDKQITIYIDKFPFDQKFNLCDKYEKDLSQCNSQIKIINIPEQRIPYMLSFSFHFPQSLDVDKNMLFGLSTFGVTNNSMSKENRIEMIHDEELYTFEIQDKQGR